jgi:hypothetical protein
MRRISTDGGRSRDHVYGGPASSGD